MLLLTLGYTTFLYGGVDSGVITLIAITTTAILALWAADAIKSGELRLGYTSLYIPLSGLIVIGLIQLLPLRDVSSLNEVLGMPASASLSLDPYATRLFMIRLVFYVVFFAAAVTFIDTDSRVRRVAWTIVILGAAFAFFGIIQWLEKPDAIYGLRPTPQTIPFGPYFNEHHFAALMEMTGGLTLGMILGRGTTNDKKPLLIIAFVLMAVATLLTSSRGGVLSFFGMAACALVLTFVFRGNSPNDRESERRLPTWLLPALGLAVAAFLAIILVIGLGGDKALLRGTGVVNSQADVTSGRLGFWKIALQIFLAHPIIGAGYDSFAVAFTRYDPANGLFRIEQAHNDYLQALADGGIAAFACVAGFIYFLIRGALARIKSGISHVERSITIGALAGCIGIFIHSLVDFPLRTPSNAFYFLTLAALAVVTTRPDPKRHNAIESFPHDLISR